MNKNGLLFEDRPLSAAGPGPRLGLRRGLLLVSLIFVGTRLLVWIGTYHGAWTLFRIEHRIDPPLEKHQARLQGQFEAREGPEFRTANELLTDFGPLCRFDGGHYLSIIRGGYRYVKPAADEHDRKKLEQNIAFFPLFPMVCWPLAQFITPYSAMVLVVHVCAYAAALVLYLWVRRRIDEVTALYTVAFTLCWPASVYYSFAYAESLTLLLVVVALWLMDARAFVWAAVVCGIATATRPTALPIAAVLVLAYGFNSQRPPGQRIARLIPLGLLSVAGIAAYAVFLTIRFGSPLVYFANFKAGWVPEEGRATWLQFLTLTPVWEQFKYFRNLIAFAPPIGLLNAPNTLMWNMPQNLFILFLSLAGLPRVPRSFRPLLALGPLIFLHSYLASGGAKFGIEPIARYTAVSAPAFIVLAAWCRRWQPGARTVFFVFLLLILAAWAFRFGLQEWSG